nr:hypothetical protein Iba_chr09aCG5570 [Ipomoea batatas]
MQLDEWASYKRSNDIGQFSNSSDKGHGELQNKLANYLKFQNGRSRFEDLQRAVSLLCRYTVVVLLVKRRRGEGEETPPLLLVGSLGVDERNKARLHSTELSSPPQPSATAATHVRRRRKHRQPTPLQPIGRESPAELACRLAPPRNGEGHRLLCSAGSRRRGWRCRLRCCRRPTLVEKKRAVSLLCRYTVVVLLVKRRRGEGEETPPLLLVGSLGVDERNKARLHSTELSSPPQPSATAATHVRRRRKHRQPTPLQPIGRESPAELARRLAPPRNGEGHRLLCSAGSRRRGWRCRLRCCRRPTLVEKKRVRNGSSIVDH